jgi:hypothetical protein
MSVSLDLKLKRDVLIVFKTNPKARNDKKLELKDIRNIVF